MKVLLIGNFAPPYEEESLHNLSLLRKLEEDGHTCSVINISETPPKEKNFIQTKSYIDFTVKLLRHCWKKDVVHFTTKGYLRMGLLKLMTSILIGKFFRAKPVVTIYSELFSIAGQQRSPVGGRQTVFTSFSHAYKIICADKDTYDVATMYQRKPNLDLIPSFIYVPEDVFHNESSALKKLKEKEKVIVFANVQYPSFLFDILKELLTNYPFPSDTGIAISLSEKPTSKLQRVIEETGKEIINNLIFIEPDDIRTTLIAYSKADIILRPLSCDGKTFFERFAISVKKTLHRKNDIYFPGGLLFVKEGLAAELCVCIINTMLCVEAGMSSETKVEDSYTRIKKIYQE
jgi:hypothetical protein